MASEVETPIVGWRLFVVVGATVITLFVTVLAIRASISNDEPRPTSIVTNSFASLGPAPVPTPGPAIEVSISPLSSGDVMVTEALHADRPLTSLDLRAPPPLTDVDGPGPRVLELQVDADGIRVSVPTAGTKGPWNVLLPTPTDEITLTYRLVGAASQRSSAADRRALVQIRPLAFAAGLDDARVVVQVNDVVVHNIVCPDLPQEEQLCGREDFKRWETVELPAKRSTVVAQVDLPAN